MTKDEILALYPYGFDIPEDLYLYNDFNKFAQKILDIDYIINFEEKYFVFFEDDKSYEHWVYMPYWASNSKMNQFSKFIHNTDMLFLFYENNHKQKVFFKTQEIATLVKLFI
jgi:hypothetical protein